LSASTSSVSRARPTVIVCAGGGGVGKTTTSGALGWALAREGKRTLVVTVDPARRLADALGVAIDSRAHPIHVDPAVEGRLFALMPEPQQATRDFINALFRDEPDALARLRDNALYQTLENKLAGMHEVASMAIVAQTVDAEALDVVVVDTAPSRHALDFVSYPPRLAQLLEGRALVFLSRLAQNARDAEQSATLRKRLFGWGRRRVESLMQRALGASLIQDLAGLFTELSVVRERFAALALQASDLLQGRDTRYLLVAAPTGAACADVGFLAKELETLERRPRAIILNRADVNAPAWAETLRAHDDTTTSMLDALDQLADERRARTHAADRIASTLQRDQRDVRQIRLPFIEATNPTAIVKRLADALQPHLPVLAL